MATSAQLVRYTGLVNRTATLLSASTPFEADDIAQFLWVKVWRAVDRYDPLRGKPEREYVFMCLMDAKKDVAKRRRRHEPLIDDLRSEAGDSWDREHGLVVEEELAFFEVHDEPVQLPSTLTLEERSVIELLVSGYKQAEAARFLGWQQYRMEKTMRTIRLKLADWLPADCNPKIPAVEEQLEVDLADSSRIAA